MKAASRERADVRAPGQHTIELRRDGYASRRDVLHADPNQPYELSAKLEVAVNANGR